MGIISELYQTIFELFQSLMSKMLVAAVIVLIGFIIGKITGKIISRGLRELELNAIVRRMTKINIHLEELASGFVSYFIYFLSIVMALRHIGLATDILNILSGGVILIIVISILLGVKDIIPNAFAGIVIHKRKFLHVGDSIQMKDISGIVQEIGLTEILIKAKNGDMIRIPNSLITNSEVRKKKARPIRAG